MILANKTRRRIDTYIEDHQECGFRSHLGASIIGKECARQIWYQYRWFKDVKFPARVCRLFKRGHREEEIFIEYLENIGVKVWSKDANGEQYKVFDHWNHFSGSADGFGLNVIELPDTYAILEFKTHNDNSFKHLKKHGLKKSKWEHYVQGTIYAYKNNLKHFLYCAVNKNDDELYFEIIKISNTVAKKYIDRAKYIIFSKEPPPRIAANPTWYKCKFCDYKDVCFGKESPHKNCRTCMYSRPYKKDALWVCDKVKKILLKEPHEKNERNFAACKKYRAIQ